MTVVYKYPVPPGVSFVSMPRGSRVLSAGLDPADRLCVWAEVPDPDRELAGVEVCVVGTGWLFDGPGPHMAFVGTARVGSLVWHVYAGVGP